VRQQYEHLPLTAAPALSLKRLADVSSVEVTFQSMPPDVPISSFYEALTQYEPVQRVYHISGATKVSSTEVYFSTHETAETIIHIKAGQANVTTRKDGKVLWTSRVCMSSVTCGALRVDTVAEVAAVVVQAESDLVAAGHLAPGRKLQNDFTCGADVMPAVCGAFLTAKASCSWGQRGLLDALQRVGYERFNQCSPDCREDPVTLPDAGDPHPDTTSPSTITGTNRDMDPLCVGLVVDELKLIDTKGFGEMWERIFPDVSTDDFSGTGPILCSALTDYRLIHGDPTPAGEEDTYNLMCTDDPMEPFMSICPHTCATQNTGRSLRMSDPAEDEGFDFEGWKKISNKRSLGKCSQ